VSGAAGGVGLLSAQFALRAGARVIGTARPVHHQFLRSLGITPVTYGEGLTERLRDAAPTGFTAVLDSVGGDTIEVALALGAPPARINTIADASAAQKYGLGTVGGGAKSAAELSELAGWLASGELVLPVR